MASFVDARGKHLTDADDTSTAMLFLPLRTFVSSIRDEERERERGRTWSLITLVLGCVVGWKLQPTNLLENNEARVEIQKELWNKSVWIDQFYLQFLYDFLSIYFFVLIKFSSKEFFTVPNIEFSSSKEFLKRGKNRR